MNMYVFEIKSALASHWPNVQWNCTSGMVVIAAEDLVEAQVIAFEEYNNCKDDTLADFLEKQGSFALAAGVYPLAAGVNKGVLHSVLGGGE